jgi:hypothetical protein
MEVDQFNYQRVDSMQLTYLSIGHVKQTYFDRHSNNKFYIESFERGPDQYVDSNGMPCFYSITKRMSNEIFTELILYMDAFTCGFICSVLDASMFIKPSDKHLRELNNIWLDMIFKHFLEISTTQ